MGLVELDPHGQPLSIELNRARRIDRDIHEMLGLCRGIIVDGVISDSEAVGLRAFLGRSAEIRSQWPANVIAQRLERIFADGVVDQIERAELQELLADVTGAHGPAMEALQCGTTLPLDRPAPALQFAGSTYVFTGRFAYGPRAICEETVRARGGACADSITSRIHYVVIGTLGSRDWAHSSFGRKIQKAVDYRDRKRLPIAIVAEDHWAAAVE